MKSNRVAIYSHSQDANAGGGLVYVLSIANNLRALGKDVVIFLSDTIPVEEFKQRYSSHGLEIRFVPIQGLPFLKQLFYAFKERRAFDSIIYHATLPPRINFIKRSYILCDFPAKAKLSWVEKLRLASWKSILVNSEFTAHWVKHYWSRKAAVLNPPVDSLATDSVKTMDILSIGRFHGGKRSKRQDVIIQAFAALPEAILTKVRLHLVGFVQDSSYMQRLCEMAEGLPVVFHENVKLEEKNALLQECGLYVHACGFEIDEEKHPIYTEHYGIAVVEAMANGCVPLVVPKGGPKYIVEDEKSGMFWNQTTELTKKLSTLLQDSQLREQLCESAKKRAQSFSNNALMNKMSTIFK